MKRFIIIVFALSVCDAAAQLLQNNYSFNYRSVLPAELAQSAYPEDPDADALVIFQKTGYRFEPAARKNHNKLTLVVTVETKVKIYNEEGIKHALFSIPFLFPQYGTEIVKINGAAYNMENGRIKRSKLRRKSILTETGADDRYVKKVMMNNVRPGSVVELKYVVRTPAPENIRPWVFRSEIPMLYASLELRSVPFFSYRMLRSGNMAGSIFSQTTPLDVEHRLDTYHYTETLDKFEIGKIPAAKSEADLNNFFDFQLTGRHKFFGDNEVEITADREQICKNLIKSQSFGRFMAAAEKESASILPQLRLDGAEGLDKAQKIAEYVKSSYKWNGRTCKSAYKKFNQFVNAGEGNSAELNLMLAGLLKGAGFEAFPVVLSDRPGGPVFEDYPFSVYTDRVVVAVDIGGKTCYIDAASDEPFSGDYPGDLPGITALPVM